LTLPFFPVLNNIWNYWYWTYDC